MNPARRVFVCTECHRPFRSREELYLHAEACLLEAFETEAAALLPRPPSAIATNNTNSTSVTMSTPTVVALAAGTTRTIHIGDDTLNSDDETDTEEEDDEFPTLSTQASELNAEAVKRLPGDFREIRKPMEYKSRQPDLTDAQVVVGARGLKLYVSVEKPDDYLPSRTNDDFVDDLDLANLDEDVSIPGLGVGAGGRRVGSVVGALANADDDGLKPKMECPTCGLVLYRHNFSTHFRIHTGELPFQCRYCKKRFRTTSAMKVHTRAHTGEKPHICPTCNYACITRRNLDRHIENNHLRDGVRRGPRYRRSRYRPGEPEPNEEADGGLNETTYSLDDRRVITDSDGTQYIVMTDGDQDIDLSELDGVNVVVQEMNSNQLAELNATASDQS